MAEQLKIALIFLTRLPLRLQRPLRFADLTEAVWAFPVVGALVGLFASIAYLTGSALGLSSLPAAIFAIAAAAIMTGGLHEEGLARMADGFAAGGTKDRMIDIMKAGRLAAPGGLALILASFMKVALYTTFWDPFAFFAVAIAAHGFSRATMAAVMRWAPNARAQGSDQNTAKPSQNRALVAIGGGLMFAFLFLPADHAAIACGAGGLATALTALQAIEKIGGVTGDVLGACQQTSEIAFVAALAAMAH